MQVYQYSTLLLSVNVLKENGEDEQLCSVPDESHCNIVFVYKRTKVEPTVRVRKLKVCTEPPNVVGKNFTWKTHKLIKH